MNRDSGTNRRLEDVLAAYLEALESGQCPSQQEWLARYPDLAVELADFFANQRRMASAAAELRPISNAVEPNAPAAAEAPTLAPETSAATTPTPGTTVRYFGDYELLEEIARGGMGVVYKARQVSLNRIVALKMILAGQLAGEADVQRFRTEAEAAANLDHPHIVPIYEVGQHEGQHYFSMKLVEGSNLSQEVARLVQNPKAAATLLAQVARAVHHAHQRGILHRDLKPANILLDAKGEPHVTDFGLAKRVETDKGQTRTGAIVGTPSYMSPEQARSEKVLTTAADVYSLGAILYELLTGRPPFRAATPLDTVLQVLDKEPERPRALNSSADRDLETICLKCLEKDAAKRYGSADALALDLERWLAGEPITARPVTAWERRIKWAKRRPAVAALVVVCWVIAVGLPLLLTALLRNAEARAKAVRDLVTAEKELRENRQAAVQLAQSAADALTKFASAKQELTKVEIEIGRQKQLAKEAQKKALAETKGLRLIGHSSALRVNNPVLALLLAIEGNKLAPGFLANNALREAIDECQEERAIYTGLFIGSTAAYLPDGKRILSVGWEPRLWDAATGKPVGEFAVPRLGIGTATVSPDGKLIVFTFSGQQRLSWANKTPQIVYTDRVVRVCALDSRREIAVLKGHESRVVSAHFSPDGKKLVTASWDKTARIWDTTTWKEERVIEAHEGALDGAVFSGDGQWLLTAASGHQYQRDLDKQTKQLEQDRGLLIDPPAGTLPPGVKPDEPCGDSSSGGASYRGYQENNPVKIWDVATGKERSRPKYFRAELNVQPWHDAPALASFARVWHPQGNQVLLWPTTPWPGIAIWDVVKGEPSAWLKGPAFLAQSRRIGPPPDYVLCAGFSPDGRRVITAQDGWTMEVWDAATAAQRAVIRSPAQLVGRPSFSPDGKLIVCTCTDKAARIWSAETGLELWCFRGHEKNPISASFSPDGTHVVTAAPDATIRVWSTLRGKDYATRLDGSASVQHLAFSPDGKRLATGGSGDLHSDSYGEPAKLWDAETGKRLQTFRGLQSLGNFERRDFLLGNVVSLQFSPDGRRLLVGSNEKLARVEKSGLLYRLLLGTPPTGDIPFTPVRIWDVDTHKELVAFQGHRSQPLSASFSPDGKLLATAEESWQARWVFSGFEEYLQGADVRDACAYIWDAATGKLLQTLKGGEWDLKCVAWSPDNKRIMTAATVKHYGRDVAARIWDVASGKEVITLKVSPGNRPRLAMFSPDGKHVLMVRDQESFAEIWDATTGTPVLRLSSHPLLYAKDWEDDPRKDVGKRTVHGTLDDDFGIDTYVEAPPGHIGTVTHAAYSPDGRRIVTASLDKTARIWDAATGKQLRVLRGHIQQLNSAIFSADGKRIVTASDDETARIWDADTGSELFTLAGHKGKVLSAIFSPDGQRVATGSADGSARIWPVDPLPLALSRKPRELTVEERARFEIPTSNDR
jgi:WD40 repeat protein/tRNA A-37 threonylcarbamoyl transferase component Bud32